MYSQIARVILIVGVAALSFGVLYEAKAVVTHTLFLGTPALAARSKPIDQNPKEIAGAPETTSSAPIRSAAA